MFKIYYSIPILGHRLSTTSDSFVFLEVSRMYGLSDNIFYPEMAYDHTSHKSYWKKDQLGKKYNTDINDKISIIKQKLYTRIVNGDVFISSVRMR
jgi:hypothetical protein